MVTIKLRQGLKAEEEYWLAKTIGPRMHYIHNSIGGQGWVAKVVYDTNMVYNGWTLSFEDERYASWFLLMFPQQ